MTETRITPRIEVEDPIGLRLEPENLPALIPAREGVGTVGLALSGIGVLIAGLSALAIGNFIASQFDRAPGLGWLTVAVAAGGFGLVGAALWRELRFIMRLNTVDKLRAELVDPARAQAAAKAWLASLPEGEALLPAIDATAQPDAIAAILRAGPVASLRTRADALGRAAAMQVFAVTAAVPSPALDGAVVALRGLRLVRQVASLHGMRPGTLGTIALVRRTLLSAVYVTAADVTIDTLVRGAISNPNLQHLAGDAAGAAVAARRMMVLARATAAACAPIAP